MTYDSLGEAHELLLTFTKTGVNTWDVVGEIEGNAVALSNSTVSFDTTGQLTSPSVITASGYTPPGADPISIDINLASEAPLVQFGGATTAEAYQQDGNAIGYLTNFFIGGNGTVSGQFSNGETKVLAMIATATFTNPSGLIRVGQTHFEASVNSGEPLIGEPGRGTRGAITASALEMSNVDLAQEFTNLIIAQRGFQANSRVITTSDEVLADLVNIKR